MNERTLRAAAGLLAAVLAAGAAAAPEAVPSGRLLEEDARLARPLPAEQRTGSLETLLAAAGEGTGAAITAEAELLARRVTFLNPPLPVRTLMGAGADLLTATWSPRGDDWRLAIGRRDREKRAAAGAAALQKGRRRLLARWQQVRRWALASPEDRARMAREDPAKFACLAHPVSNAGARLAFLLPGTLHQRMWSTGLARVRVAQLPRDLVDLAFTYWKGYESGRTREQIVDAGDLAIALGGAPERPTVFLSVRVGGGSSTLNVLYAEGWVRQPASQRRAERLRNPTPAPRDPRFAARVTLRDPQSGPTAERPAGAKPLLTLLRDLAPQVRMPILAEVDWRPRPEGADPRVDRHWFKNQWWLAGDLVEEPLPRALDLLCADFEYEWRFQRGVLLLRHSRWYLPAAEQGANAVPDVLPRGP